MDITQLPHGKGVFIWRHTNIYGGNITQIADELEAAGVSFVAIKICNGTYAWPGLGPLFNELERRGIVCGSWGYVYLNNGKLEAEAALRAISEYQPAFFLIDAEREAKNRKAQARIFAETLSARNFIPLGMCSYWKPSYHRELPWVELRSICQFDAPQVYWRGSLPVGKLLTSKKEYSLMSPKLPYLYAGGDMYSEGGIKPTPAQVTEFLTAAKSDGEIKGVIMWSMDQMKVVPELWRTFASFRWDADERYICERVGNKVCPLEAVHG